MSLKSHMIKVLGVGAVVTVLTAGAAFAAVATANVNVRSGPSGGYRSVDRLFAGEVVGITDRSGGWCEVSHPGRDGWVNCAFLSRTGFDTGPRVDRFHRSDRFDRFDREPSFGFSVGPGGFGMRVGPPPRPWWY